MAPNELDTKPGGAEASAQLHPLIDQPEALTAVALTEQLGLWDRPGEPSPRPRVLLNMVSTADGRATLAGRSGPVSGEADRELFHALRASADAILVGAGTVRTERYGRILRDAALRAQRERRGLSPEPLACVVSGRLALAEDIPLLRDPGAHVIAITASEASLPETGARIDYVRTPGHHVDLTGALEELAARFAVQTLLCEGGPHLARELFDAALVDELFLTLSPLLAGGEPSSGEALRILAGAALEEPVRLDLLGVVRSGSYLFLRYGVLR